MPRAFNELIRMAFSFWESGKFSCLKLAQKGVFRINFQSDSYVFTLVLGTLDRFRCNLNSNCPGRETSICWYLSETQLECCRHRFQGCFWHWGVVFEVKVYSGEQKPPPSATTFRIKWTIFNPCPLHDAIWLEYEHIINTDKNAMEYHRWLFIWITEGFSFVWTILNGQTFQGLSKTTLLRPCRFGLPWVVAQLCHNLPLWNWRHCILLEWCESLCGSCPCSPGTLLFIVLAKEGSRRPSCVYFCIQHSGSLW